MIKIYRDIIFSSQDIEGCYRFDNFFQISSLSGDHKKPPESTGDFPLLLEFAIEINEQERHKLADQACVIANDKLKLQLTDGTYLTSKRDEIIFLLSLFTRLRFFVYSKLDKSWFISFTTHDDQLHWGQKAYFTSGIPLGVQSTFSTPAAMLIPSEPCSNYFDMHFAFPWQGVAGRRFYLPDNIDTLFKKYQTIEPEAKKAFLSSCTLFYHSLKIWFESKSLTYSALISCLETLISYEYRNNKYSACKECKSTQYQVMAKFRNFFNVDDLSTDDASRKYIKMFYDYRNNILHKGLIFKSDEATPGYNTPKEAEEESMLKALVTITRKRILTWLLEN